MEIRHLRGQDYHNILPIMNDWWGGREMTHLLPRFLCDHFQDTSYVLEEEGQLIGFLIGFLSQSEKTEAYIHLVGVNPDHRRQGLGRTLYKQFWDEAARRGVKRVHCLTSPANNRSMAFHFGLGFSIVQGDKTVNNISVHTNYDGMGNERVMFVKNL